MTIPNTKIASNVGPQIDPKDIDSLETQRGSYASDIGDRTYGVFNVLPRNGFERDREAELLLDAGNFSSGEAQLSLGDHSAKTAWYTSLTGSRSNYGLATPIAQILHDADQLQAAVSFPSFATRQPATNFGSTRNTGKIFSRFPTTPTPTTTNAPRTTTAPTACATDKRNAILSSLVNWVRTLSPKALFSVAPFYHFNQANYDARPTDLPVATTWHQTSNYIGGQADTHDEVGPNSLSAGIYTFYQAEHDLFGVRINDSSAQSQPNTQLQHQRHTRRILPRRPSPSRPLRHFAGRRTHLILHAGLNETAAYPRIGATVEIPHLHWVLRGFYGHFFQPAPVQTVSSSVLNYASSLPGGENTFTPLPSERDEEHQFGIQIPWRGWMLDVDTFKNRVNNFLDHSNLGESNMYFPIGVDGALVRAWEMTLRSPQFTHFGKFHLAYSNQIAEQRGDVIGGFTCTDPNDPACALGPDYTPVDHDQRHTLNTGFTATLPAHTWFASNVYYGSGFANGLADSGQGPYQAQYLPVHTTFDLSAGHTFGERWKISANVLNVTNHRVLLDNSITVGGFHTNDPRIFSAQMRYRFHF